MTVKLNAEEGTFLHLPLNVDARDWARDQQIAQDDWTTQDAAQELLGHLRANFFFTPKPLCLMAGPSLPVSYYAWLATGADGSSTWLQGCAMCPAMDVIDDYPQVAARIMMLHEYIARSMGCLIANVTLHIPMLSLYQARSINRAPRTRLCVQQGRLRQYAMAE